MRLESEPLADFFLGPGQTRLRPGDLVTCIQFPLPPDEHIGKYIKLGRNASSDLAIVGVTVLGFPDEKAISGYCFRLALASVAPTPIIATQAEQILANNLLTTEIIAEAAVAAQDSAAPISDPRGTARYRKLMVRNLTRKGVTDVWDQLRRERNGAA